MNTGLRLGDRVKVKGKCNCSRNCGADVKENDWIGFVVDVGDRVHFEVKEQNEGDRRGKIPYWDLKQLQNPLPRELVGNRGEIE